MLLMAQQIAGAAMLKIGHRELEAAAAFGLDQAHGAPSIRRLASRVMMCSPGISRYA